MAEALRTDVPGIARNRRLSGLPAAPHPGLSVVERLVRSKWFWAALILTITFVACLIATYTQIHPDRRVEGGIVPGMNNGALIKAWKLAWPTLIVYSILFLLADRYRPQRLVVWFIALGWGGCVATYLSLEVNTWAAEHLSVGDSNGNQLAGARAAIYIAPFVEEAAKATILFVIAFLDRYRLANKLTCIAIGGLSAIGFAVTEDVLYYARAIVYGSYSKEAGDVAAAVAQLAKLRGVWTSFGHPLFTTFTALGVAFAVRSRSKIVRVMAPIAGYLCAAFLHMTFNSVATVVDSQAQKMLYFTVAIPLVLLVVAFCVVQVLREGTLIGRRLTDFVRMGWLPPHYPAQFARLSRRVQLLFLSLFYGNPLATFQLVRAVTDLAYLRDAMTRGIVDSAGRWTERDLLARIRTLRDRGALTDTTGLKPYWTVWRRRSPQAAWAPPSGTADPLPTAALHAAPVLGSAETYSVVDPRWAPPR